MRRALLGVACVLLLVAPEAYGQKPPADSAGCDYQQLIGQWSGEYESTSLSSPSKRSKGQINLTITEIDAAKRTFVAEHHFDPQNPRNRATTVRGKIIGDRLEYNPGGRKYTLTIVDARTLEGEGSSTTAQPPLVKIVLRKTK